MSLLENTKKKRRNNSISNPLANQDILKKQLEATSLRISGDIHSKILAMKQVKLLNAQEVIDQALELMYGELTESEKEIYDKYYQINFNQKVDLLKQKGKL